MFIQNTYHFRDKLSCTCTIIHLLMSRAITQEKIAEHNAFRETQDHIMYSMCAKFHQNPWINLGGVGGTNLCLRTDRRQDRKTDRQPASQPDRLNPVYPLTSLQGYNKPNLAGRILTFFFSFQSYIIFTIYYLMVLRRQGFSIAILTLTLSFLRHVFSATSVTL
jgi:hypothetical protein